MIPRDSRRHPIYKIVKTLGLISGPMLEPNTMLFPPRPESVSKVASRRRFGAPLGLIGTASGAPEQVIIEVNSMSHILTLTRSPEPPSSHLGSAGGASGSSSGSSETSILGSSKTRGRSHHQHRAQGLQLTAKAPGTGPHLYISISNFRTRPADLTEVL